ncbi:Rieske 2Fe-2S domain-containing protein [Kitasatospora sp. NPDC058444]|uniref:Rieske 2Fe-2S domain-containing protein n=1 Tax=Kitasatospora sp. NPDC058444 TaxID=3346504 RepID=UPI0036695BD6
MRLSRKYAQNITQGPTRADLALAPVLPYPDGWSAVAFSGELKPGSVLTRRLHGEDVVLYRLRNGVVRAVQPYCPHLGAHLGLAELDGDDLVCPFHRFAYGPDGACVRTGYGTPPPKASLTGLPVREVNEAVFVWWHHDGRAPDWEIPEIHTIGHLPRRYGTWEMPGHAQEIMENSVDVGHFGTLHGWAKAELPTPVVFGEKTFHVSMRVREKFPLIGESPIDIEVDGYGIGFLHSDSHTPRLRTRMCTLIMGTMIEPNRMQYRQASRLVFDEPSSLPKPLAHQVSRTLSRLLIGPLIRFSEDFTAVDYPIWYSKKYRPHPRLAKGDGPIGPFRHWARQFYPHNQDERSLPGPQSSDLARFD